MFNANEASESSAKLSRCLNLSSISSFFCVFVSRFRYSTKISNRCFVFISRFRYLIKISNSWVVVVYCIVMLFSSCLLHCNDVLDVINSKLERCLKDSQLRLLTRENSVEIVDCSCDSDETLAKRREDLWRNWTLTLLMLEDFLLRILLSLCSRRLRDEKWHRFEKYRSRILSSVMSHHEPKSNMG